MDTDAPDTAIAVPGSTTSLSFPVTVTGTVPTEPAGFPTINVTSFDVYVSANGHPWTFWQTLRPRLSPDTATAYFTGTSDTAYSFYSVATDNAGNTGAYNPTIQASIDLPSLDTSVTQVASSSTYNGDGTFTLNLSGTDAGGNGLAYFWVDVAIDSQPPMPIGPAIPAGVADGQRAYTATTTYVLPSSAYGSSHTYKFYSAGIDAAGLVEPGHSLYDDSFSESYSEPSSSQLALDSITVEHGAAERSFVRYVDLNFNDATPSMLQSIVNAVNGGSNELTLTQYDLNGHGPQATISLKGLLSVSVIDDAIEIDFNVFGVGNDASTADADGYYTLTFTPPAGGGQGSTHHFFRLLGDVDGSGTVDQLDLNDIAAARGQSVGRIPAAIGQPPLSMDVNGDGSVNNTDLLLATKSRGRSLATGLPLG
jgi:hypothetical protein